MHDIILETKRAKTSKPIVFSDNDLKRVKTPYDDAIVITTIIVNFKVHKIMIDSGSVADVLFYDTFLRMNLLEKSLNQYGVFCIGPTKMQSYLWESLVF